MVEVSDMTLLLDTDELLTAIWSAMEDGTRAGIPTDCQPESFNVCEFTLDGGLVFVRLKRREEAEGRDA